MKPVLTTLQMRECDRITIEDIGLPGIVLMESASKAVAAKAVEMLGGTAAGKRVTVFCGRGNNGGDGLAAARHLQNQGGILSVILACDESSLKGDSKANAALFRACGGAIHIAEKVEELPADWERCDLIIDALLGTGFSGEVTGFYLQIINLINSSGKPILSIDIPSGISGDVGVKAGEAVRADATVTFGFLKSGLLYSPGRDHAGDVTVADIGIPLLVLEKQHVKTFQIEEADVRRELPVRAANAHKWDVGCVYLLCGSPGLTGAATLAARAAMLAGAGQVAVGVPESLNNILEIKLTEPMSEPLPEDAEGYLDISSWSKVESRLKWADAVAFGPGIGRKDSTVGLLKKLIETVKIPLLLDADGLFLLAANPELLNTLPRGTVITPHLVEMSRLTGLSTDAIQANRLEISREYAAKWGTVLHLKGAPSITASPDGLVIINSTGNAGMATGGSGDVLAGIITAFLGTGMKPFEATWTSAYVHGLAGDLAKEIKGERSLLAGDILESLPQSLNTIN